MQQQAQINESFLKQLLSWHRFLNFSGKAGAVVFNKSSLKVDKDKVLKTGVCDNQLDLVRTFFIISSAPCHTFGPVLGWETAKNTWCCWRVVRISMLLREAS